VPDVTVLMSLFNSERHLRASIDSILAQTYRDFELLIVDDGSSDRSVEIARSCVDTRIRVVVNERNLGLAASLNRGLAAARGALIARQDSDDVSHPDRLERQVAVIARRPELALLGSQANAIDEHGRPLKPVDRPIDESSIRWYGLFDNPFIHTSVMFRRAAVWNERLRGYPELAYAEDYALWSRVIRDHPVANLRERLVTFRVHALSKMRLLEEAAVEDARAVRFREIVRTLVRDNVAGAFDDVSSDDAALMADFVLGVPQEELGRFLGRFADLLARYVARPGFRWTADFSRTLARQVDAIACRVRPARRRSAARVYANALRIQPALLWHLSWPRAAALVLFGPEGRTWFNSLRRYSRRLPA
jgi:hypothetical protein